MEFGGGISPTLRLPTGGAKRRLGSEAKDRDTPESTLTERGAEPLFMKFPNCRAQLDQKVRGDGVRSPHIRSADRTDSEFLTTSGCLWTKKNDLSAAVGG